MRSTVSHLLVAVALWGSICGCSLLPPGDVSAPWGEEGSAAPADGIDVDADRIPGYAEVWSAVTPLLPFEQTRPLTAAECACLAGARSPVAALMEKEAAYLRRETLSHRRHGVSRILREIIADRAIKERNDAAREALIAYYQLVEVILQRGIVEEGEVELRSVEETINGLRQAGLAVEVDPSELTRRHSQLELQKTELLYSRSRLTVQVKSYLSDDPLSSDGIEPNCAVEPLPPAYGLDEAIQIARRNDFELRSLRRMLHGGDVKDLDVARKLLATASPFLGQAPGRPGMLAKLSLLGRHDERGEQELQMRRAQLQDLYAARQLQLDLEVANALATVQERFLNVGIAKDVMDSWDDRVAVLESNRELQRSNYLDVSNARSERLKAKSDLLHKLILLEIEHVRLQALLGTLWEQCTTGREPGGMLREWMPAGACPATAPVSNP